MTESPNFYPHHFALVEGGRCAVIDADTGEAVSYSELDSTAWRIAHLLRRAGADNGATVAICAENSALLIAAYWGATYAGVRYVPISARATADELDYLVNDAEARVLLLSPSVQERLGAQLAERLADTAQVQLNDATLSSVPSAAMPGAQAGTAMLYSSGTTGRPKAVRTALSGAPLGQEPSVLTGLLVGLLKFTDESVYLSPAPLHHAAPWGYAIAVTQLGATLVLMRRFDAAKFLAAVSAHRVTHTQLVPTMMSRLMNLPIEQRQYADVSSLQCVVHAGAPCPVPVKKGLLDWLGPIVHEYYSGSEGAGFVYCSPADWLSHPGTVGRSMLGAVHIVDVQTGVELPAYANGVVYFENSQRFEYHGDRAKTDGVFSPQGWGTFGDIGHLDVDGFLYLTGRKSDVIITGGVNVYPREVEDAILTHPEVRDVAVIGVPDPDLGEAVHAVIELTAGIEPSAKLTSSILGHCSLALSRVKCPRSVSYQNELPRTETGKVLKRELRSTFSVPTAEVVR